MAGTQHTAGPWKFIDATKVAGMQFAPKCVIKAGDKQIASFSWNDNSPWFPTKDESQANARLIAAAPDLLEAVTELLVQWDAFEASYGNQEEAYYKLAKYARPAWNKARAAAAKAEGK